MSKVTIHATVGLSENETINLTYYSYPRNSPSEWDDLEGVDRQPGGTILIRAPQFGYEKKVQDVVRATWNEGKPDWQEPRQPHPTPNKKSIVVVLESPHEDEYDDLDNVFKPVEPLMDPASQTRFRNQIVGLVNAAAELKSVTVPQDAHIVLMNPVQFQTSIHRLVKKDPAGERGPMRHTIRNATWKGMWCYQTPGGEYAFQLDFITRLDGVEPCLIMNACTSSLRPYVQTVLNDLRYPAVEVCDHPSAWDDNTKVGPCLTKDGEQLKPQTKACRCPKGSRGKRK